MGIRKIKKDVQMTSKQAVIGAQGHCLSQDGKVALTLCFPSDITGGFRGYTLTTRKIMKGFSYLLCALLSGLVSVGALPLVIVYIYLSPYRTLSPDREAEGLEDCGQCNHRVRR